jgi:uncharacterized Zn finger protein
MPARNTGGARRGPPDWSEWGPAKPVEGGLTARAGRRTPDAPHGAVGFTLIRQIVGRVHDGVASRGRAYARNGQTLSLRIGRGEIDASVQGAMDEPYSVRLRCEVPPRAAVVLPTVLRRALDDPAAGIPAHAPAAVMHEIAAADLLRGTAVTARCTCPYGGVCKHCIAVAYVAAERLDASPAAVAQFLGVPLDGLGARDAAEPRTFRPPPPTFDARRQAALARTLRTLQDRTPPTRDAVVEAALRVLPAPEPVLRLLGYDVPT